MKGLCAIDLSRPVESLKTAVDLLNHNRIASGIDNYAMVLIVYIFNLYYNIYIYIYICIYVYIYIYMTIMLLKLQPRQTHRRS